MDLLNPWNQINLRAVTKGEQLQFYDTNIRFIYTLVGGITIQKEGEKVHLGNDDFYILTKSQWYELSHISGKVFMVTLEYNGGQLGQVQRLFQGDSINNPRVVDEEVARSVKQLLLLRATSTESLTNLIYKEYFTLVSLLEKYYSIVVSLRDMTQGKNRIIEVKNYIDLYFDKELTLGELAKKIYVSEQYLSKIFKDEFGIGVSEYIIRKRLEKVRKFLTETEYPITDIAFDAGFTNINSFNRLFKKYQGVTPSTYRQETKSHVTTLSRTESLESEEFTVVAEYIENDLKETHHHTIGVSVNETTDYQLPELLINLGFAEDLLHRSYIKTVEPIQRYVPFQYGRVCGIFDQNIMVEVDGEFDFTKVDDVIQAIFDLGLKPFLELGMKGKFIFDSDYNPILEQEIQLPTNRLEDLLRRYQALLAHCVDYYGVDEVGSWKIELWKPSAYLQKISSMKQQVVFTYQGESLSLLTEAGYRRYFKIVSRAIKAVVPCIAVGGCGFQVNFIKEGLLSELEGWLQSDDQPDFLSFYAFPIENIGNTTTIDISSNVDYIRDALHVLRQRLSHLAPLIPVYMTEFNVTIHHRAIINDTCFKGPYILKNIFTQMAGVPWLGIGSSLTFLAWQLTLRGRRSSEDQGLSLRMALRSRHFMRLTS